MALPDDPGPALEAPPTVLPRFRHSIHLALVGADPEVAGLATKALAEPHYALRRFERVRELGGGELHRFHPQLLLVQPRNKGETARLVRELKGMGRYSNLPVLVLLPDASRSSVDDAFENGVSDVLTWPFTVSQLRARVETGLFRGGVAVDRRARGRAKAAPRAAALAAAG